MTAPVSKAGHAPGPWSVKRVGDTDFRAPSGDDFCIVAANGICPGTVWEFGAEGRANAALIAAAPLLLDALQSLRARLIECSRDSAISAADAYDSFYQELVDEALASAGSQKDPQS